VTGPGGVELVRQELEVDGTQLSCLTAGDPSAPPLLLLHGTFWSRVWQPVLPWPSQPTATVVRPACWACRVRDAEVVPKTSTCAVERRIAFETRFSTGITGVSL